MTPGSKHNDEHDEAQKKVFRGYGFRPGGKYLLLDTPSAGRGSRKSKGQCHLLTQQQKHHASMILGGKLQFWIWILSEKLVIAANMTAVHPLLLPPLDLLLVVQ